MNRILEIGKSLYFVSNESFINSYKNSRVCKRPAQNAVGGPEKVLKPNIFRRVKNICAYIKQFLLDDRLDRKEDSMSTGAK